METILKEETFDLAYQRTLLEAALEKSLRPHDLRLGPVKIDGLGGMRELYGPNGPSRDGANILYERDVSAWKGGRGVWTPRGRSFDRFFERLRAGPHEERIYVTTAPISDESKRGTERVLLVNQKPEVRRLRTREIEVWNDDPERSGFVAPQTALKARDPPRYSNAWRFPVRCSCYTIRTCDYALLTDEIVRVYQRALTLPPKPPRWST